MDDKGYRAQCLTDRYLLLHVLDSNMHTDEERALVEKYRQKHRKLVSLESQAQDIRTRSGRTKLGFFENIKYRILTEIIKAYRNSLTAVAADPHLQGLIERERAVSAKKTEELQSKLIEDINQRRALEKRAKLKEYHGVQSKSASMQNIRESILLAMNVCEHSMTSIGKLALATMMPVMKIHNRNKNSYVCQTNLASCDTVIYSAFLVRALALRHTGNDALAKRFTDEFYHPITVALAQLFPMDDVDTKAMFNSRMMFYNRVFAKKHGMKARIQAVTNQFELILKTDALYDRYVEIGENSPLPFAGTDADQKCSSDVDKYQTVLLETIKNDLEAVQESLKR